jgi:hypothetical protein
MSIQINAKDVELDEKQKMDLDKLVAEYESKIKRRLKTEAEIIVHVKAYGKGKKKQFKVSVEIVSTAKFGSTADDYDIAKAIHEAFNRVLSEIEHRFHSKY